MTRWIAAWSGRGRYVAEPLVGVSPQPEGLDRPWHALDATRALELLQSERSGLPEEEARRRLDRYGANSLPEAPRQSALARFVQQFQNPLIYVLLVSGLMSVALGHAIDAVVIFAVVVLNAAIGFVQEGRAERALDAIRGMIDPAASVLREGRRLTVAAGRLVPGDVVLIEPGDRVPADLRILDARNLRIDEAALTGESVPVDKLANPVESETPLGDRFSMAHSGTIVAAGQGSGVVVATGAATELGRIGTLVGAVERLRTPLVRQMDRFARQVTAAVLAVAALIFLYAWLLRAYPLDEAFMAVVGLAVAAIPEGLPTVMTIALAIGVQRMAARHAIVRRLPAVETIGAVSAICTDKTGTLTRNEMMASALETAEATITVEGEGYEPQGRFVANGAPVDPAAEPLVEELALAALLCNDSELRCTGESWVVDGDPMEGALVTLAVKAGHDVDAARQRFQRLDTIPFDSRQRFMATLHAGGHGQPLLYVKGAPERVLAMCSDVATREGPRPLDPVRWHMAVEKMAAAGARVIALACSQATPAVASVAPPDVESGLTLLGLIGLIDPPRAEARTAVAECRAAGIEVKMITGDHLATARAVAAAVGLAEKPIAVAGSELNRMDDAEFRIRAGEATVFARTSPEHKLRLVEALQADGSVIAMTGDGVNDAPALKRADIGIAMGRKGTEAAKEASQLVLADDNFASIVAAVREGRTVYDNLTKMIAFTLPTNGGEAFTIILAILFGLTLPVTPVQILWINMVTAVALDLALAFEPTEPGTMRRPPRPRDGSLLSGRLLWRILFVSALMVAGAFGVFAWAMSRGLPIETARTMVVNAIVVTEIFYLFSVRYVHGPSLTWQGVLGTPAVLLGILVVVAAQLAFTYLPPMQGIFDSRALSVTDGLAILTVGPALLVIVEIEKRLFAWSRA